MEEIVNINGRIVQAEEARISVFDRGFLYGDSVYEVTRSYEGVLFLLDEHLDRLWNSAAIIGMKFSFGRPFLVSEIKKTFEALGEAQAYIRVVVTRGEGPITLDPGLELKNNLVIIGRKLQDNPSWWYTKGVSLGIVNVLRNDKRSIDPNAKSGNYLNNILAYGKAKEAGFYDAVMENHLGNITEGTTSNVFIVCNREIWTPPLGEGLLRGITRTKIIELCQSHGILLKEKPFTAKDLLGADECFISSSTREVVPVTQVNDRVLSNGKPGEITQKVARLFREYVQKVISEDS